MRVYWTLPEFLQANAYFANGEYAWSKDEAQLVIEHLTEKACAVIGVEIWLATDDGPTIPTQYVYGWEAESYRNSETWPSYVRRVNVRALKYIGDFAWHPKDRHASETAYFNLTVAEEGSSP